MYAAPVWLWNNLDTFKGFWQDMIMKITGAMLNPKRSLVELALQLPPLEVQLESQTVKFLCKLLSCDDTLTAIMLQIEGSLPDRFHKQLKAVKNYIHWKYPDKVGRRTFMLDLLQWKTDEISLHYTKEDIQGYQRHRWMEMLTNQMEVAGSSASNEEVSKIISCLDHPGTRFDKTTFLFNHRTSKREDSHILDFIHGNSLLFGKSRKSVLLEEDICYFCQQPGDGPIHQLFNCEEVKDESYYRLMEAIQNPKEYVNELLLPMNKDVQPLFIDRVKFLLGQHDFIEELIGERESEHH